MPEYSRIDAKCELKLETNCSCFTGNFKERSGWIVSGIKVLLKISVCTRLQRYLYIDWFIRDFVPNSSTHRGKVHKTEQSNQKSKNCGT